MYSRQHECCRMYEYNRSHEMIGFAAIGRVITGSIADKTMLTTRACPNLVNRISLPEGKLSFGLVCLKANYFLV